MDENFLRFDVQRQYRQLEQAYQSNQGGSASLPSSTNSRLRKLSSSFHPEKASTGSPYAIPGLPLELQVSFTIRNCEWEREGREIGKRRRRRERINQPGVAVWF